MRLWTALACACIIAAAGGGRTVAAQSPSSTTSTKNGVYTVQQAIRGQDVYAGMCQSCHTAATHSGAAFANRWSGRKLSELYDFLRQEMPKNEPGILTPQEYADLLAYMLRVNRMPTGTHELPADSAVLKRIRIEAISP